MSQGANMLKEAFKIVEERGKTYGPMKENMTRTAKLWSVMLGVEVTAAQVATCLIQLKMARLVETPGHVDSVLDVAGYAAVLRECMDSADDQL